MTREPLPCPGRVSSAGVSRRLRPCVAALVLLHALVVADAALWDLALNYSSWTPRDCSNSRNFHQKIWVFAGGTIEGGPTASVFYADPHSDGANLFWAEAPAPEFGARMSHAVVVVDAQMCTPTARPHSAPLLPVMDGMMGGPGSPRPHVAPRRVTEEVDNTQLLLMGGIPGVGQFSNDVWCTVDGELWTKLTPSASWPARAGHNAVFLGDTVYLMAGSTGTEVLHDVWSSTDGVDWTLVVQAAAWPARVDAGAASFNGSMYIMGGKSLQEVNVAAVERVTFLHDVWSSTDGHTWTQLTQSAGWSARSSFGLVVGATALWLFGGYPYTNDVWRSSDGGEWQSVSASSPWHERAGLGVVPVRTTTSDGPEVFALLGGHTAGLNGNKYYQDTWFASAEVMCVESGQTCSGHGACSNTDGCSCAFGWSDAYCSTPVCSPAWCQPHGSCVDFPSAPEAMASAWARVADGTPGVPGKFCQCHSGWTGPRCATAICREGCSDHGSCVDAPNTCACEPGWTGPVCTIPTGSSSQALQRAGEWVMSNSALAFGSIGGGCMFLLLSSCGYMNYWARRPAASKKLKRRVHWGPAVVHHGRE